jgi:hypothetical protein
MNRIPFQVRCRAAFLWAMGFVIVGEYTCRDAPFESLPWLAAGLVLAGLAVLAGSSFLNGTFEGRDRADAGKLHAALSRVGVISMAGIAVAAAVGWFAEGERLFNAAVAGGDFAFGLFVLWSQFWFVEFADEKSPGRAPARPG